MQTLGKSDIINLFPGLAGDSTFQLTSPIDPNYNCIAWAYMFYKDRWMSPPGCAPYLDGVQWWPDGITEGMDISCLVEAFEQIGFTKCDSDGKEAGYIKVALYYQPNSKWWTHAARQMRTKSVWMSKLGQLYDIEHRDPYVLEGNCYGRVYCIMKKAEH